MCKMKIIKLTNNVTLSTTDRTLSQNTSSQRPGSERTNNSSLQTWASVRPSAPAAASNKPKTINFQGASLRLSLHSSIPPSLRRAVSVVTRHKPPPASLRIAAAATQHCGSFYLTSADVTQRAHIIAARPSPPSLCSPSLDAGQRRLAACAIYASVI